VPASLQETHRFNRHALLIADLAWEGLLIQGDKRASRLRKPVVPGEAVSGQGFQGWQVVMVEGVRSLQFEVVFFVVSHGRL
jgi:hypothetical protein